VPGELRIACISDTHDVEYPPIPEVDAIIHAGDITLSGSPDETLRFLRWFDKLQIKHKLFIGGNHDRFLSEHPHIVREFPSIHMLWDSAYDLEGYKVWGSPVSRSYGHIRAFAKPEWELERHWSHVPDDTDILVTHGPPYGVLDTVGFNSEHLGDTALRVAVRRVKPDFHIFGHIHGGRGFDDFGTIFVNAAVISEAYRPWPDARKEITVLEPPKRELPVSKEEEATEDSSRV
jgi:Icc-related predicted phosphoesterase